MLSTALALKTGKTHEAGLSSAPQEVRLATASSANEPEVETLLTHVDAQPVLGFRPD